MPTIAELLGMIAPKSLGSAAGVLRSKPPTPRPYLAIDPNKHSTAVVLPRGTSYPVPERDRVYAPEPEPAPRPYLMTDADKQTTVVIPRGTTFPVPERDRVYAPEPKNGSLLRVLQQALQEGAKKK